MNLLETYANDIPVKATNLSDWLIAHGIPAITTAEAASLMGISEDSVRQRIAPLRKRRRFVSPSRGLWVPVPPDRLTWGAPEPAAYLDTFMMFLGADYYVGWLNAAALQGAAHQATQLFQVAVDKRIKDRTVGRSRFHFLSRSRVNAVPTTRLVTPAGAMTVSTPGATMLDLMEDHNEAGGLDNAVTVVVELAEENKEYLDDVLRAAPLHSDSAVRRLGWALEEFGDEKGLDVLAKRAIGTSSNPSLLSPHDPRTSVVDVRWMLNTNREVDPDL